MTTTTMVETIYRKKQAKQIFAQIPEWSRIIILPVMEESTWFNQDHDVINQEIASVRKAGKTTKLANDYSSLYIS
jgi:hypothetical protein